MPWLCATTLGATVYILSNLFYVTGKSMSPFINSNTSSSFLFLDRVSCLLGLYKPQPSDVVVFKKPGYQMKSVVKRVSGISGDKVFTRDNTTICIKPGM